MRKRSQWVELTLHGQIEELRAAPPSGLRGLLARLRPRATTVAEVRALVARSLADPDVAGLLVSASSLHAGWSTLSALRAALRDVVTAGKRVVLHLPEGGTQRELFVASAASSVFAPASASFSLLGPLAQRSYVVDLLTHLGLRVEVIAEGRFKTAAEALVRDHMSEAEREQSAALVATLKDTLIQGLHERVGERAEQLFELALFGAEEARAQGLVDQVGYRDELESTLGLSARKRPLSLHGYMQKTRPRGLIPLRARARVAVLALRGPIGDVSSSRSIAFKPTATALSALAEREDVLGVLLYLDTPGGSAAVSDLLHHEVRRLALRKPVIAWMGNVAASGGYYLAAAAQRIVARDCTVTGSIGVISAHLVAADLFARIGVSNDVVKQTQHADLASVTRPLSEQERALLSRQSARFYERFLDVVAAGRNLPRARIEELAQGRVWSGRDAHALGLVDRLGGYEAALGELKVALGERAAQVDWALPLVVQPRAAGNGYWGAASALTEALWSTPALTPARDIVELARAHGPLLAYALGALDCEP